MVSRLSIIICWLVLVTIIVGTGCEHGYREKEEAVVHTSLADSNFIVPDYASQAIEATGGRQAWIKVKKLEFDCVVTFYKQDDSFYLTEQHHEIHPWRNSVRILAREPQGDFIWELSRGQFSVLQGRKQVAGLPIAVVNHYFAEAILSMATAPIRFLDGAVEFALGFEPVKIEGRWYHSIERTRLDKRRIWSKALFCQNRDSFLVDMIWFGGTDEGKWLAVRGYDYMEVEKGGILVPTKMEIFGTDTSGALKQRLVRIDYYALRSAEW